LPTRLSYEELEAADNNEEECSCAKEREFSMSSEEDGDEATRDSWLGCESSPKLAVTASVVFDGDLKGLLRGKSPATRFGFEPGKGDTVQAASTESSAESSSSGCELVSPETPSGVPQPSP
jgi:hypothetical protein